MITVQQCQDCGRRYFPARLLCAECDAMNFTAVEVTRARVEMSTVVHDAETTRLVTLANDDLVLIGALHGQVEYGDLVPLHPRPVSSTGPVAVVPGTGSERPSPTDPALQEEPSR